ncbi:hypothetical protein DW841_35275 [Hungatella hathewayi]|nr:hypothetical protein DW841_35275 [Hungatella hathewayi]
MPEAGGRIKALRRNEREVKTGENSVLSEGIYEVEINKTEINQKDINQKDINGMEPASCRICLTRTWFWIIRTEFSP